MTRSRQRSYQRKHGIVDIQQWCPRCGHFNVARRSHKYFRSKSDRRTKTNKRCSTANCPGPAKGEVCSPPDDVIEKHLAYLRSFVVGVTCYSEASVEYWEAVLRRRRGEKLPIGICVSCKQTRPLKKLVLVVRLVVWLVWMTQIDFTIGRARNDRY